MGLFNPVLIGNYRLLVYNDRFYHDDLMRDE